MAKDYRALTRAYRPFTFDDIVSQEHVSSTLRNAIAANRLSHAYMFCGPRGVGKTTMARVLAREINQIDQSVDGEALTQTLNIVEIDAASHNKVDDIHQLRESVRIPPQNGRYKVFIIDEVHMLSKAAFNALLKTLEEPPPHAIFIFATTEPHKVLPTILSRVQRFDFRRISVEEIVGHLREIAEKESVTVDDESLHLLARKADGALRDALGLMDQAIAFCGTTIDHQELLRALNTVGSDQLFQLTEMTLAKDTTGGLTMVQNLLRDGIDIQEFLVSLTEHLRNLYVAIQTDRLSLIDATPETRTRYKAMAGSFSEEDLLRMMHITGEAQIRIRDVQQPRVHFEMMVLKLMHMHRSAELSELLRALDDIKKNGSIDRESLNTAFGEGFQKNSRGDGDADDVRNAQNGDAGDAGGAQGVSIAEGADTTNDTSEDGDNAEDADTTAVPDSSEDADTTAVPDTSSTGTSGSQNPADDADASTREIEDDIFRVRPTLGFAKGISSGRAGRGGSVSSPSASRNNGGVEPSASDEGFTVGVKGDGPGADGTARGTGHGTHGTHSTDRGTGNETDGTFRGAHSADRGAGDANRENNSAGHGAGNGRRGISNSGRGISNGNHGIGRDGSWMDHDGRGKDSAGAVQDESKEGFDSLEEAQKQWGYVLDCVQQEGPDVLFYQLQRVQLKEAEGRKLLVAVDNEFSRNMVEENQERLATLFKRVSGQRVRVMCTVENQNRKPETIHPYEKFKEMQKSDPLLKDLVDLFGAELDYD